MGTKKFSRNESEVCVCVFQQQSPSCVKRVHAVKCVAPVHHSLAPAPPPPPPQHNHHKKAIREIKQFSLLDFINAVDFFRAVDTFVLKLWMPPTVLCR